MLVVEDEPLLGQFSVRILEIVGGMEATLATDGIEGLEMAWKWRPDVILLDLVLPGISGLELLRRYRQEGGRAKVLVVTGINQEQVKNMAFALGADFLLRKPAQWEEILEQIRLMAGGLAGECEALLRKMGAPEGKKGFHQAAQCAALLGEGRCELLKEAYIEVAAKERTSPECISKNIERLAQTLHSEGSAFYYQLVGRGAEEPWLTNREFLNLLSQAARIPL